MDWKEGMGVGFSGFRRFRPRTHKSILDGTLYCIIHDYTPFTTLHMHVLRS